MPLVPGPAICENCKTARETVEMKLRCDLCKSETNVRAEELGQLPINWPLCHDEFKSLIRHTKCSICGDEREEYFPNGRLPLDCLPGTHDRRVFIGGNYLSIKSIRDVKDAVYRLNADFIPILPYDDFQIPPGQVYDTDLRLLHNCKYAIFEVTNPGGELFEIARCAEYKVNTLLVYQARGFTNAPPNVKTMLLESGPHEHRSYLNERQLEHIVDEFLRQKNPTAWQRAVSLIGYRLDEYSIHNKLAPNGESVHTMKCTGLKVIIPNLRLSEIPFKATTTSGRILRSSFHLNSTSNARWCPDNAASGARAIVGVIRFDPALDSSSDLVTYEIAYKTKDAYMLTKKQLDEFIKNGTEAEDPFLTSGREFASREITHPVEKFKLRIEFPRQYPVNDPQPSVYFGAERRTEGLKIPPDSFTFIDNNAILEVNRPLIFHRYAIAWEVPTSLERA